MQPSTRAPTTSPTTAAPSSSPSKEPTDQVRRLCVMVAYLSLLNPSWNTDTCSECCWPLKPTTSPSNAPSVSPTTAMPSFSPTKEPTDGVSCSTLIFVTSLSWELFWLAFCSSFFALSQLPRHRSSLQPHLWPGGLVLLLPSNRQMRWVKYSHFSLGVILADQLHHTHILCLYSALLLYSSQLLPNQLQFLQRSRQML